MDPPHKMPIRKPTVIERVRYYYGEAEVRGYIEWSLRKDGPYKLRYGSLDRTHRADDPGDKTTQDISQGQ